MDELFIRQAVLEDLDRILKIYEAARAYMKRTGNPTQWGDNRPSAEQLEKDVCSGCLLVLTDGNDLFGACALLSGPEKNYAVMKSGRWLNDAPYYVVHRVASDGRIHGVLKRFLSYAEAKNPDVRIDTHENNKTMQHLLEKMGYVRCGIVTVDDGTDRIAYQKIISK